MEVILLERVAKLGQMGEIVKVRDGYARNFLLKRKKALRATEENRAKYDGMKADLEANNLQAKSEAAKAGRTLALGEDICWGVGLYLADSVEEAVTRVEPYHDERYKWFAPFGFVRYADEEGRSWGMPGAPARVPSIRDGVAQKAWLCGPPRLVIEQIKEFEARYPGLEHMMIHWAEGMPPKEFKEQLSWFARDVMPAFAGRR